MITTDQGKDTADQVEGLFLNEGWKKLCEKAERRIQDLEAQVCRGDMEPADYARACGEIRGIREVLETLPNRLLNEGGKPHRVKE